MSASSPSIAPTKVSYLNVSVSEKGLVESHGSRAVVFIPKEEVQSIEVKFGPRAERPLMQTLLGLVLLALGGAGLYLMYENGARGVRWGLGFLFFGGLGVLSLHEVFKKGYYLEVVSSRDQRKLIFKGTVEKQALTQFVQGASHLGYRFKDDLESGRL